MTENEKRDVAVFRYSIISDLVNARDLSWGEQERLIREKCLRKWSIPFSEKTRISRSCVLGWVKAYKAGNGDIRSLYPNSRKDKGKSRAIDEDTCLSLIRLRKEMPAATVPILLDEMKARNLVTPGLELKNTTVYRFLNQQGVMRQKPPAEDRRKFEAPGPNELWQSDVMHGPRIEVDGKLRKTYLIAIIDDHSRLIPHGEFYLSEGLSSYLVALEQAFLKRGLPRKLYVDNGSAFRSKHLEYITASLNIALIHARPYKPQGKGKIERWFRIVRTVFLPRFKGCQLSELNEALDLWINEAYHKKKHSATGQSPFERFTAQLQCIRPAPDNLKDYFRKVARRKVAKDRSITFNGKLYEAPVPLIGSRVELLYHDNDPDQIEVKWKNKSYGILRPVDLHVNCRVKRDDNNQNDVIITTEGLEYKGGSLL
ncbi:MAG: DDE-type integrase/transposase/recombinase [Geobacteraceae bacterium]